jgi:hypothetical protein
MTDASKHDAVGYKRPPVHTRFRRGESGNPAGRPKRRPTLQAVLLAELATAMPGTDAERGRTKLHALVQTLVDSAIAGNARAQTILMGALVRLGDAEDQEPLALTPDDREILDAYVGGELQRRAAQADASKVPTECPTDRQDERRRDANDEQNKSGCQ